MLRLTIDGTAHEFEGPLTVLDALRTLQVDVPTLCHDDRLKPYGGCRLCVVEDLATGRLVSACSTPAVDGMRLLTHSESVEAQRKTNLRLLAARYPADEPLSEHVEFHRYLLQYGIKASGTRTGNEFTDTSHPYLKVDME